MSLLNPNKGVQPQYANSSINTRLYGYHLQTSLIGVCIPIIYGRTRVNPNVIWAGNFQATPANGSKGKSSKGSKGGAGQQYNYSAALVVAICQGPVSGIIDVWVNQVQMTLQSSSETYTIPPGGGTYTPTNSSTFVTGVGVSYPNPYNTNVNDYGSPGLINYSGTQNSPFKQTSGSPGAGQYTVNPTTGAHTFSAADAGKAVVITYVWFQQNTTNIGGKSGTPLTNLNLTFFNGALGQAAWSYLASNFPNQALGYSEMCYVANDNVLLGSSGVLPEMSYEIQGFLPFGGAITGGDAAIDQIIQDFITNPFYGMGLPSGVLDAASLSTAAGSLRNYCLANGIFISPLMDSQRSAADWVEEWLTIANAEAVYSEGVIKFRARGDTTGVGNGVTFTPNTSPIYDLDDDDYLATGEDPLIVNRPTVRDANNRVPIEWWDRGNAYAASTLYEEDPWAISQYGLRIDSVHQFHSITTQPVAVLTANTLLKYSVYVRNQYKFSVPAYYGLLEPMDMLTISDPYLGFYKLPVRILEIEENDNYELEITAEDFPWGTATPTLHPKQVSASFGPGYFSEPGNVYAPVFFEAPPELTQGIGYELFIGLSGGADWGGCHVWVSTDGGNSYKQVGAQLGPSTMGFLTAALPASSDPDTTDTLSVDLTESDGALESNSQAQADAFVPLVIVGQELIAYETATLTSPNEYNLTYLRRGVYDTAPVAHDIGSAFLVLDKLCFSYIYDASQIGQTVYFKFTSYNKQIAQEQSVSEVTAYKFHITSPRQVYPWKPAECAADPGLTDTRKTFPIQLQYIYAPDQSVAAQLLVFGSPNINVPSAKIAAPVISCTTSPTGGSIPGGQTVLVAVQAFDASSNPARTQMSNIEAVVIPSGTNTNSIAVSITWPANNSGGEVLAGSLEELMAVLPAYPLTTSQASVTLTNVAADDQWQHGPVDVFFDHLEFRYKYVLRGGINGTQITAVTSTTVTMNLAPTYTANQFNRRLLALVGRGNLSSFPPLSYEITANTANTLLAPSITLTIGAHSLSVGDTVAISTLATTHTALSIGDNLLLPASAAVVSQYLANFSATEVGAVVRIISGTGYGPANDRKVTAVNTSSGVVYTVSTPFDPVPDATSVFILLGHDWFPIQPTHSTEIAQYLTDPMQPHVIEVPNVFGMYLIEAIAADDAGGQQDLDEVLWRYWFTQGKGPGYFIGAIVSNTFTPDLSQGFKQAVVLNQSAQVNIAAPIWTGGVAQSGVDITIIVEQDSTGGRPAPSWDPAYVDLTDADKQISASKNTSNTFKFHQRPDGKYALASPPMIGRST